MSANRKVLPTKFIAADQFPRDREGALIYPRIIARNPKHGDIHALPKKVIGILIPYQKIDYINGIHTIELRPRISKDIGNPFGFYLRSERLVVLYSVPSSTWVVSSELKGLIETATYFGAKVSTSGMESTIEWLSQRDLAQFMYCEVFLHELGHHYDWQYRSKRPPPVGTNFKEASAELHSKRLNVRKGLSLWRNLEKKGELPCEW